MKKIGCQKYTMYKIAIAVALSIIVSSFVVMKNFIVSLAAFAVAIILVFILNKKVKDVTTDERIDKISGKASRIVMVTSVMIMSVAGIVLVSLRDTYPQYWLIGNILVYFECGMMFLYSILFKIFSRKKM